MGVRTSYLNQRSSGVWDWVVWAFCWVRFSLSQFPACWDSSHWTFFMFSLHCGISCQVGFCCAWPLPCGGWAKVVSARLNPRHGTIYVGCVCNFLGCVSPQQRFEMVDQCYSSVTAEFYSASKGEMCLFYANLAGHKGVVFVSPEVLTLVHGFCFVPFFSGFSLSLSFSHHHFGLLFPILTT